MSLTFKHEWFGHKFTVFSFDRYGDELENKCMEEWMTQDEKEAVGDICYQIYQGRVTWEKEQSLAKQRESFMNLTGEY